MNSLQVYTRQHPVLASALITLVLGIIPIPLLIIARLVLPDANLNVLALPLQLLLTIIPAFFVMAFGSWQGAGFNKPGQWCNLRLLWLPLLLAACSFLVGFHLPAPAALVGYLIMTLLIALSEEMIYRGLLIQLMLPTGILRSAIWSAVFFGLVHCTSFALGRDPGFVVAQVISSVLGGFGLAALRLRMNTIWPLVMLHTLNDFVQFVTLGGFDATNVPTIAIVLKIAVAIVPFLYGLFLLRQEWRSANNPAAMPVVAPSGK
jgi:membrane protease YdiL (CAAX protease family)